MRRMIEKNVRFEEIDGELVKPSSPRLFVSAVEALTGEFPGFQEPQARRASRSRR